MARPKKYGLDYFPLDVSLFENKKMEAISGEFGDAGLLVTIKLMCDIYQNGYYTHWKPLNKMQLLSRIKGATPQIVEDVVQRLITFEVFDEHIFNTYQVLTSKKIQETFLEATKKRKDIEFELYICQEINVCRNPTIAVLNDNINTQSKEKESKEEEIKENKIKENESKESSFTRGPVRTDHPGGPEILHSNLFRQPKVPDKKQVEEFFLRSGGTLEMADHFFKRHEATAWFLNGSPITNFHNLVPSYIKNWIANVKNKGSTYKFDHTKVGARNDYSTPF